jgi:hypothetical protein
LHQRITIRNTEKRNLYEFQISFAFRSVCLGDYTNTFVDHIIDIFEDKDDVMEVTEVTAEDGGAAAKTEAVAVQSDDAATPTVATTTAIDFEALKTLSDEGKEYRT